MAAVAAAMAVAAVAAAPHPGAAATLPRGVISVTDAPWRADPSGVRDATAALQAAIDEGARTRHTVFIPPGRYRVTDTLNCSIDWQFMTSADTDPGPPTPDWLFAAHVIVGAPLHTGTLESDAMARRPTTLFVPPATPGFTSPVLAKYVVHFWHTANTPTPDGWVGSQPDININQVLQGVDIEIGAGNLGAIGVMHLGAQGSSIEDVTVWAGDAAVGISGGAGGGGAHTNVRVVGGRFGLDLRAAQPAPTVTAATLQNQTCSSILYIGRGPLTLVGAKIESHAPSRDSVGLVAGGVSSSAFAGSCSLPVPAHPRADGSASAPFDGSISIIDSSFEMTSSRKLDDTSGAAAPMIASEKNIFLRGVYTKGFSTIVQLSGQSVLEALPQMSGAAAESGSESEWNFVTEFAASKAPKPYYKSVNTCHCCADLILRQLNTNRFRWCCIVQLQQNFQLHDVALH